jgi:CheY-like chemotaxis protein
MKILLVDDDEDFRCSLAPTLRCWGHDVVTAADGMEAYDGFKRDAFDLVVCDLRMPGMDGLVLCRSIRQLCRETYTYIIMVTAAGSPETCIEALDSGADDFVTKPVERDVLAARLRVAERILGLHVHVARLEGLLAICSYCKRIRKDDGGWTPVESYIQTRSDLKFSHGVCEACMTRVYPELGARPAASAGAGSAEPATREVTVPASRRPPSRRARPERGGRTLGRPSRSRRQP